MSLGDEVIKQKIEKIKENLKDCIRMIDHQEKSLNDNRERKARLEANIEDLEKYMNKKN